MPDLDLIVIGGGASGITAAATAIRAGQRTLLIEAGERLGGCVHTWRPCADFWLELGAHTAYNSYGAMLALNGDPGFANLLPRAKLGYHFFQAGRLQSPFARLSLPAAALHLPFGLFRDKAGEDVRTWFGRLLGSGNWRRLLEPAFAAVLSQPAGPYPAAWLFKRKPRVQAAPRKFTHAGGLQGWLEELAQSNAIPVRLGAAVQGFQVAGGQVSVELPGEALTTRRVVIATPLDVAARLLDAVAPELAARLAATPLAPIETEAVVVAADKSSLPPLAGLIGGDDAFFSAVSRDYLPHPRWRGFAFHFKPGRLDLAAKRQRMAEVLGCRVEDFAHATSKTNVLPALTPASVDLAAALETRLAATPVRLAGNYLNGLSLGDSAVHAAAMVERLE